MFYKDYLPVIRFALIEWIITEINLGKNQYFLLEIIDLQVKLQIILKTIVKIFN